MNYPKECGFCDVCEPCGLECNGLPCVFEQSWKEDNTVECVQNRIRQTQARIDERNRLNENDELFLKRQTLMYQKLTGQLEMSFEERLERAR